MRCQLFEARLTATNVHDAITHATEVAQIMPARTIGGARAREATLGFKEFLSRVEEERMKKMMPNRL